MMQNLHIVLRSLLVLLLPIIGRDNEAQHVRLLLETYGGSNEYSDIVLYLLAQRASISRHRDRLNINIAPSSWGEGCDMYVLACRHSTMGKD